jgi:hypothetical protein
MDGEAKTQTIAMRKKIYLYRALWLALLDIDRCKSDRDHSDYKFRARKTQIASLQDICEQKHLKRYGNKDQLHNFTGESLYQALANQWNVLRTTASMTFTVLFREGTGSCKRSRLNEFQNGYDAFVREEHLLPQKNGVAGRQVVVEIPAPRSNREYEIMVPISSRCSKRKEDFTQVATPKRTTRNDRKRKLSSDIDAPRRVSKYIQRTSPMSSSTSPPSLQSRSFSTISGKSSRLPMVFYNSRCFGRQVTSVYSSVKQLHRPSRLTPSCRCMSGAGEKTGDLGRTRY